MAVMRPFINLALDYPSLDRNDAVDVFLGATTIRWTGRTVLQGYDAKKLPGMGNLTGLPPLSSASAAPSRSTTTPYTSWSAHEPPE